MTMPRRQLVDVYVTRYYHGQGVQKGSPKGSPKGQA